MKYKTKGYFLTGKGSFHDAPTIEGLTIATGMSPRSSTRICSASAFVYVYVFGRGLIKFGVNESITSSLIQLKFNEILI